MPTSFHSKPVIEPLSKYHNRAAFDCGVEALGRYIWQQAMQDAKRKIAATFVLTGDRPESIVGYYTLSSTSVNVGELPEQVVRKLPRYPLIPATLIGRLAVDRHYQGRGYGELLLVDALRRSLILTEQIGSAAVIVDAKDDKARAFYEHFQFIPLISYSHRLFLPMAAIEDYFAE
ncbi:GNAT family N-acetyltransferase [Candidatus Magnetominusculus dajiuhuensis]|uniref:GNAT family N-acetyltransferase n=1 Tax=Candidatus Magnetominusculus dajiuhuensis TaxID=3137712 RepID=UPI003B43193B